MDKKKLIGTIIGVIMFAALIAGATFAWLTFAANVYNATYISNTMNFLVDYTNGTAITDIPIVKTGAPTAADSSKLVVQAKKHSGSPDGNITIQLTTSSSNTLTTGGIVHWALCKGECSATTTTAFNENTCKNEGASGNCKATGKITAKGTINLWTDPTVLQTTNVSYYVYFWIDAAELTNDHLVGGNNTYSGYIHAYAEQTKT